MEGYRHLTSIEMRFRDLDALGHVNNVTYLTYVETARFRYFVDVGLASTGDGLQIPYIVAHVSCDFKRPIFLGQQVVVGTRVNEMGRSSIRMGFRIEADGALAAEGEAVIVSYDYEANQSTPVEETVRTRIEAFEGDGS